jgi:hypothetical protein
MVGTLSERGSIVKSEPGASRLCSMGTSLAFVPAAMARAIETPSVIGVEADIVRDEY